MADKPLKLNLKGILTDKCDIFANETATGNYGHTVGVGTKPVAQDVPCKLLSQAVRFSQEFKSEKKVTVAHYTLYIMPLAPPLPTISEHMWVQIDGVKYNIVLANPPQKAGAPHEIALERVKP